MLLGANDKPSVCFKPGQSTGPDPARDLMLNSSTQADQMPICIFLPISAADPISTESGHPYISGSIPHWKVHEDLSQQAAHMKNPRMDSEAGHVSYSCTTDSPQKMSCLGMCVVHVY